MPFAQSGDVEIFYARRGEGPPLLLINGFGPPCEWIEEFYLPHFINHFDCAWFDLRGVGRSGEPDDEDDYALSMQASDVAAVLDALDWPTAHIWGASFGAALSLQFASSYPGRARSLALCGADAGIPDIFQKPYADIFAARRSYFQGVGRQIETPSEATESMLEAYFPEDQRTNDPRIKDVRNALIKMLSEHPLKSLMSPFKDIAEMGIHPDDLPETAPPSGSGGTGAVWEHLEKIDVPTLLLQGYSDSLVHRDAAFYVTSELPNIELRLIKPAGHSFAISDEQLDGMADWIRRREASRAVANPSGDHALSSSMRQT